MPLDQLANVAEIIAAALVVVSLWFVVVQLRQNTHALRSASAQSVSGFYSESFLRLAENEPLMQVWIRGGNEPAELKGIDRGKYISIWNAAMWNWQNLYYQQRHKAIEPGIWQSHMRLLATLTSLPGFKVYWAERKAIFSDEFQNFVEQDVIPLPPVDQFRIMGMGAEE